MEREQIAETYRRFAGFLPSGDLRSHPDVIDLAKYREICVGVTSGWVRVEAAEESFAGVRAAMPDVRFDVEDLYVDGDTVIARGTITGTNTGSLFGMPPSGRPFTFQAVDIARFENGKIIERWLLPDLLSMMRQAGLIPSPNESPASGTGDSRP